MSSNDLITKNQISKSSRAAVIMMESDIEAEEITEEIQIIKADKYDDEGHFQ